MARRLYFGHPKGTYNTVLERKILTRLNTHELFQPYQLVNPNTPVLERRAAGFREANPEKSSMPFFLALAGSCSAGIFLIYPDGAWSSGAFTEAQSLLEKQAPIWSVDFNIDIRKIDCGLNEAWRLSREETSARNDLWRELLAR